MFDYLKVSGIHRRPPKSQRDLTRASLRSCACLENKALVCTNQNPREHGWKPIEAVSFYRVRWAVIAGTHTHTQSVVRLRLSFGVALCNQPVIIIYCALPIPVDTLYRSQQLIGRICFVGYSREPGKCNKRIFLNSKSLLIWKTSKCFYVF